MKVLFLTPWYPTPKDQMAGLFVQKHVEAVRAQGIDVRVLHSYSWEELVTGWITLRKEWGLPDVVQLNIIQKQGLLALLLKWLYDIPYVIIEHWSGYLPENGQYLRQSEPKRYVNEWIAKNASSILPVSDTLCNAMQTCGIRNRRWEKVNNVVDDFFFYTSLGSSTSSRKVILHVSCFDERAKNVKGLLRAIKSLSKERTDFRLVLVGDGIDYRAVRAYAEHLNLGAGVLEWTGELPPMEVAKRFEEAAFFVLPSNYENAPVVIAESLATGTPVLSTQAGGIPEMVSPECGLLVPPKDDEALTFGLDYMLDNYTKFNPAIIREYAKQYSSAVIGEQLKAIYEQIHAH